MKLKEESQIQGSKNYSEIYKAAWEEWEIELYLPISHKRSTLVTLLDVFERFEIHSSSAP